MNGAGIRLVLGLVRGSVGRRPPWVTAGGRRSYRSSSNIVSCDLAEVAVTHQHLSGYLWGTAGTAADTRTALVDGVTGASLTYAETRELSRSFGSALAKLGCQKGDVLALVLPNCIEYIPMITGSLQV